MLTYERSDYFTEDQSIFRDVNEMKDTFKYAKKQLDKIKN